MKIKISYNNGQRDDIDDDIDKLMSKYGLHLVQQDVTSEQVTIYYDNGKEGWDL